jgi:hypothetical protein
MTDHLHPKGHLVRRKRPRQYSILFQAVLAAAVFLPKAAAFTAPSIGGSSDWRISTSLTHKKRPTLNTSKRIDDDDDEDQSDNSNWLRWMVTGGRPRGTQKVRLNGLALQCSQLYCVLVMTSDLHHRSSSIFFRILRKKLKLVESLSVIDTRSGCNGRLKGLSKGLSRVELIR